MRLLPCWLFSLVLWWSNTLQQCESLTVSTDKPVRFFIGGLGYCGSRLATRLREEFPSCQIAGCVRSKGRKESVAANLIKADDDDYDEIRVHVLDLDEEYKGLDEDGIVDLLQATHIVQTVAPIADFDRDPLLALHQITLEESTNLQWVGYLSSTGVYGNYDGEWVDEHSELRCQDAKSLARVKAESEWQQLETNRRQKEYKTRIDCFRCGGIYGPGRGPLFSSSLYSSSSSSSPEGEEQSALPKYVNRILVDDVCGAIVAAVKKSNLDSQGKVFNLVDDDPAPRRDVVAEARRLVGVSTEQTGTTINTSSRRRPTSRNTGNKRCRNQLLKDEYQWEQRAPTYREGLAYLWQQQQLSL